MVLHTTFILRTVSIQEDCHIYIVCLNDYLLANNVVNPPRV